MSKQKNIKEKKMKIFIADDSELMRNRLITLLSGIEDIEIIGLAGDCSSATESIKKLLPDIVILDIRMPGGSGIEVLQKIKKDKNVPVIIMLTNYAYPQYEQKCFESGADFFLDKSEDFPKIGEIIKQLTSERAC